MTRCPRRSPSIHPTFSLSLASSASDHMQHGVCELGKESGKKLDAVPCAAFK
jgi:hypothetical protein